jgi:hypothetical protein
VITLSTSIVLFVIGYGAAKLYYYKQNEHAEAVQKE